MNLKNTRKALVAGGFHTLRFVGLLAIGIGIGVATTEMLPEPVAAAASDCNGLRCESTHFWWWHDDFCEYQPGSHCFFLGNPDQCFTSLCEDPPDPCEDDDPNNDYDDCDQN